MLGRLAEFMVEPFEEICREWTREAGRSGRLKAEVNRVGSWWAASHQIDVVGLDREGRVTVTGECKWQEAGFDYADLEKYLHHIRALDRMTRPDARHILFSKTAFAPSVQEWAQNA
jgi:uncharacterized protein